MPHHFIRDYVEYGTVKIQFVHSEENLADPFTKNLSNGPPLQGTYTVSNI